MMTLPRVAHTLPGHLIVSLTSHNKRFKTLEATLRRILGQTVKPDATILWVSKDDYPLLPKSVIGLQQLGLEVHTTKDFGPHTKIVPALKRFPESFIITLDDDIDYPLDLIEPLVSNYRAPNEILCRRAHVIRYGKDNKPIPYMEWSFEVADECHPDLFPTGVGGVLYPPRSLHPDVLNEKIFRSLTPTADDIWLYFMAKRAGSVLRRVGPRMPPLKMWPGTEATSLMNINWHGGNDRQFSAMLEWTS